MGGLLAGLMGAAGWAVPTASAEGISGTFSVQLENDRIANTDRHYTQGLRLGWVSKETTDGPKWAKRVLKFLYPLDMESSGRIGFALGHNIYTPEDTDANALVTNDRPYAGWLYGAVSLHAEAPRQKGSVKYHILDSVELNLGVVGPSAHGGDVQNGWHEIIGVARSNGWDNQLRNEPAIALFVERKWRLNAWPLGGVEGDVIPHIGGSLGNVFTQANTGAIFRIGQGLDMDFGPPHIRPTLSGLGMVGDRSRFGWYVFAGGEARLIARNIFLDGNSFNDSHSVSKKLLVGDFQFGAAVIFHGVRLAITNVIRTKEFDEQRRADRYGAISLSVRF